MPEKKCLQNPLLLLNRHLVNPPAARKGKILGCIGVCAVKLSAAPIIQNRPANISLQQKGIGEIIVKSGVLDRAVVNNFFIMQNRLGIKLPGPFSTACQ